MNRCVWRHRLMREHQSANNIRISDLSGLNIDGHGQSLPEFLGKAW